MTCTKCGAPLGPGAMFCGECGTRVVAAPPPPPALVEPSRRTPPPAVSAPPASAAAETRAIDPWVMAPPVSPPPPAPVTPPPAAGPTYSAPPESAPAPVAAARHASVPIADDADDELDETVISPRRTTLWRLVAPSGERYPIAAPTIIGRAPVARPGAVTLALVDETMSLSKSHALLDLVDGALVIEDLGSTNGVIVHDGDAEYDLPQGTRLPLVPGVTLELGEYIVRIAHD